METQPSLASLDLASSHTERAPVAPPLAVTPDVSLSAPAPAAHAPHGAQHAEARAPQDKQAKAPARSDKQAQPPVREASRYRVLADFLADRYRVSRVSLERFVRLAYVAGHSTGVDPLLILAVMAVESSFNPVAESVMGAKGLMQIIPEYHRDKLRTPHGGEADVLDPEVNIFAGAKVLREYAARSGHDVAAALRLYGGTAANPAHPYPDRVLAEWQRLAQVLRQVPAHDEGIRRPGENA